MELSHEFLDTLGSYSSFRVTLCVENLSTFFLLDYFLLKYLVRYLPTKILFFICPFH
jgi:hypothetical protein